MISGNMEIAWPACSPYGPHVTTSSGASVTRRSRDTSPATWVSSRRSKVNLSLDEDVVRKAVWDVRPRAEMCIKMGSVTVEEI